LKLQTYGLDFSKHPGVTQLEIELLMAKEPDPSVYSGYGRDRHIKHIIQMLWPWAYKGWNDWSELCLWAWCNYDEIGTTGCAAAGKTFTFTMLSLVEYLCQPQASRLALTSTTVPSLRGRIWAEVTNFMAPVVPLFGLNVVDSQTKIQFKKGDDRNAIIALAVDSGSVEQAVGKLQGVHTDRMIIVVDEAAQTQPAIFSARANLQVGTTYYRFVAIANASSQFDAHGKFCEPKLGWSTITADDDHWETNTGICLHFDGLRSPNVKAGQTIYPKLFAQTNIDTIKKNHGENSLEWWSYVRGFWAPTGVRNTVLDAATIQEGRARDGIIWQGEGVKTIAALDPAFTTDGDDCCLRFAKVGKATDGGLAMLLTETIKIQLEERVDYPLFYQVADKTIAELQRRGVQPEDFTLDATGGGAGIADIISQRWQNGFRRVSFGGAATDDLVSTEDEKTGKEVYFNRVTQLWFNARQLVMAGRLRGLDDDTAKELCTRLYSLKNEKIRVESKKEMKLRTSGTSPDKADACALLADLYIYQNGLGVASGAEGQTPYDFENFMLANEIESSYE
jgi:hypothetical protein